MAPEAEAAAEAPEVAAAEEAAPAAEEAAAAPEAAPAAAEASAQEAAAPGAEPATTTKPAEEPNSAAEAKPSPPKPAAVDRTSVAYQLEQQRIKQEERKAAYEEVCRRQRRQ